MSKNNIISINLNWSNNCCPQNKDLVCIKWQLIALNHLADTEFKDFMKRYKDYSKNPFSILVKDTTFHEITH